MASRELETSEAEEMYLITIAMAVEDGHAEPVSTSRIAERLEVSGVSANQMIHKLDARGLVLYTPYRGAALTDQGKAVASSILRSRRLWGVFLSDRLGLSPAEADTVACELEHVTPAGVADLLSTFLGHPSAGPRGRSIPESGGTVPVEHAKPLTEVAASARVSVVSVALPEPLAQFVMDQGITPGETIEILGVGGDGDRLVNRNGTYLHLGTRICHGVLVEVVQ